MAEITSYPAGTLNLDDYLISTIQWSTDRTDAENVTRNFKVSEVVNTILAALNIGTVTSIATASSEFISVTGGTITTTGTITADLSATGTPSATTFLRGDGTWSLPGPAASKVAVLYNGTQLTDDANSMNYTGNVTAVAANSNVTLNMPGSTGSSVDSVIAGTAISVNAPTGNVTITNTGVTQARAGGNITLSGGTGSVTESTTANAGTVSSVSPGLGIATIANNTSNPEIDLEFTGSNNYISRSETPTTANPEDFIEFNQLSSSNVKSVGIGDIPPSILTAVKKYIDDEDANKLKNDTDTYTTTEKAMNMVSLTITEYNALVSGGTIDENTLYFIVGAGTAFTVNPVVTNNITGTGYSINTTPSSVTGVAGTPYTFTTTVTVQPGGSFSGTNPVVTSDVINNSSGNPYNKAITISGAYTPPAANTGQARLNVTLLSGSSGTSIASGGFNSIWRYVGGKSQPGDLNPIPPEPTTGIIFAWFFNAQIEIMNSNYEFTGVGPEYEVTEGSNNFSTGASIISGALIFNNTTTDIYQRIKASYALKQFTYGLTQTNSLVDSSGTTGGGESTEYTLNFSGDPSGTYNINTNITGTWTATVISPYEFSDGTTTKSVSITPFSITANETRTLTLSGTLVNTTPNVEYRKLDATAVIQAAVTGYGNGTINDAVQGQNPQISGSVGLTYTYTVPTITANSGYYLTGGVVTLATNPVTYGTTGYKSGAGTSGDPYIENDPTVTAGVITANSITTKLDTSTYNYTGAPAATYSATFTNSTPTTLQTTTGSGTGGTATDTGIATGVVSSTAGISKGDPALGDVVVKWVKNSITPPEQELSFNAGATIGGNYTFTSLVDSDTIEIQVVESDPADVVSTLDITTNIGGSNPTEFTIVGNQIGDTNTAKPGAIDQQFDFYPDPNTDYEFTTGPSYEVDLSVATMPYIYAQPLTSSTITIKVLGDINAIIYTVTLAYANSISGGTAGVEYTLSPAGGSTRTGAVGAAYSFPNITATPATGYYFSTPFNATQTSGLTLPLNGTMPSGGGTASQTLTGVIAPARATIQSVCVAVPVTTAITYATSFAPGGSGATRTLTTTGTQTLSNSAFEYGNGTVTVTVNRTAPSSSAQDGGSIQWNLNGVQQGALQTITIGATISYSRTITGVTAGDTISVSIAEG